MVTKISTSEGQVMVRNVSRWLKSSTMSTSDRSRGDHARDNRDWTGAEKAYDRHLAGHPDDFDIWVQYGHVLKEQEKLAEAEEAYKAALALQPSDPDANLHLAHLLKRGGRESESADAFLTSFEAAPTFEAYGEMGKLGRHGFSEFSNIETAANSDGNAILVEVDDLFGYLEAHQTLSGIQRVQVEVIRHVLDISDPSSEYAFVLNPPQVDFVWKLRTDHLRELVGYLSRTNISHDRLKGLIAKARSSSTLFVPGKGQCYVVLGAFWGSGGVALRYSALKKAGVVVGVYIYDLIPITHPEHCDARLSHEFALSFADGMAVFDFVLTISEFTAGEVRRYLRRHRLPEIRIAAVPLAHSQSTSLVLTQRVWGPRIAKLRDRSFVLMVSTIESRKNHAYLVSAWKHLLEEGLDPPDLVFVGRFGWRVAGLMDVLGSTNNLDGRVHIVHDLSDAELQTLYSSCLFTVFPSFVEGWGLPVGESLSHGKACVASSTSSVPEVGGDLVAYLDPYNMRGGIEVLRRMMFDHDHRAAWETRIAQRFKPRTWHDVSVDLLTQVKKAKGIGPRSAAFEPPLASGSVFEIGSLAFGRSISSDYPRSPVRLILVGSWYSIEETGCWMRSNRGVLAFQSDLPEGTEVVLYMRLVGAPWATDEHVASVWIGNGYRPASDAVVKVKVDPRQYFLIRCKGRVGADRVIVITLEVTGEIPLERGDGERRFVVGLSAIGYSSRDDLVARMDLAEHFMFHARMPNVELG